MIVAESIGFAGTHTICSILSDLPGYEVAHGSQDFESRRPIGAAAQTPEAFVASMAQTAEAGAVPVAVHCLFPAVQLKPACDRHGIRYSLLVREPERQIESCYAWAAKKLLDGEQNAFVSVMQAAVNVPRQIGIETTLPNVAFIYAVKHVCGYNISALNAGAEVMRMEDLLGDETAFRAAFAVPQEAELQHFAGDRVHLASHRSRPAAHALADPDREAILRMLRFEMDGRTWTVGSLGLALGY